MKRRSLRTYLIVGMMLAAIAGSHPGVYAAPKSWEPVKTERTDTKTVLRETELELQTASGVLIVNTNHPVQIKIFTILGRLVNSETLQAGRSQLMLPAHGVYIVKIGDLTCKVAV